MKNLIRKIIGWMPKSWQKFIWQLCAEKYYCDMVEQAERLSRRDHEVVYLMPDGKDGLIIANRNGFRNAKREGHAPSLATMFDIKRGCVYRTAGAYGVNPMDMYEAELRRKVWTDMYIKFRLR